jgi:acetyl esterase/lipase
MVLLIDLLSATLDFELEDMRRVITETNATKEKGLEPEQIIILSQSTGIHLTCNALNMLSNKDALKLSAFHTIEQALISLDLKMHQQEIIRFYHESKAVGQKST